MCPADVREPAGQRKTEEEEEEDEKMKGVFGFWRKCDERRVNSHGANCIFLIFFRRRWVRGGGGDGGRGGVLLFQLSGFK